MTRDRELGFDDYVAILRRRRWLLITPALLGAVSGYLLSRTLPSQYTSHTVVLVEQPTVPDSYVKPVVSEDLNQRLASMQEQILSRTRLQNLVEKFGLGGNDVSRVPLQNLVEKFGLHGNHASRVPLEDLIERLRKSIVVIPLDPMQGTRSQQLPGFSVNVTMGEARLAQRICAEITSMFMEQNVRLRQQQAEETTQFLAKQLEEAKVKLDEQDAKLAAFQTRYIGELPDDEKTNLTLLMGMTPQLDAATQALNQAQQEKTFAESLLSQHLSAWKSSQGGQDPQSVEQQLSDMKKQLASLQGNYTDKHPDVVKLKNDIAQLQQKKVQDASVRDEGPPREKKAQVSMIEPPEIQQLRAQIRQIELTVSQKTHEQEQLQRQIRTMQGRIQLSPVVQQQFKALTRDYQTALTFYNDLLKKRNESQMATELESRRQGEQFRVLDPPSLPQRPSFPNRVLFSLGGLGAGLFLGLGMVQVSESRDKSMRTRRDVELYLGLPTLAVISFVGPAARENDRPNKGAAVKRAEFSLRTSSGR